VTEVLGLTEYRRAHVDRVAISQLSEVLVSSGGEFHQPTEPEDGSQNGNEKHDPHRQLERPHRTPQSTLLLRILDHKAVLVVEGRNGDVEHLASFSGWDVAISA